MRPSEANRPFLNGKPHNATRAARRAFTEAGGVLFFVEATSRVANWTLFARRERVGWKLLETARHYPHNAICYNCFVEIVRTSRSSMLVLKYEQHHKIVPLPFAVKRLISFGAVQDILFRVFANLLRVIVHGKETTTKIP